MTKDALTNDTGAVGAVALPPAAVPPEVPVLKPLDITVRSQPKFEFSDFMNATIMDQQITWAPPGRGKQEVLHQEQSQQITWAPPGLGKEDVLQQEEINQVVARKPPAKPTPHKDLLNENGTVTRIIGPNGMETIMILHPNERP